jgi:hypothetical protein
MTVLLKALLLLHQILVPRDAVDARTMNEDIMRMSYYSLVDIMDVCREHEEDEAEWVIHNKPFVSNFCTGIEYTPKHM